jgi:aryl-alcohol dehydrogenase-like predicted oxidoreductase
MGAVLGLGLAALGRPGYITVGHAEDLQASYGVAAMERRCHTVLDAARMAGVRWFDVARSYGRAEEFLAHWLGARAIAPGSVTVSSKWGYTYTAGWRTQADTHEVKDHTLAALERQWGESRALLGAHLSLYQIHSATLETRVLDDSGVLRRLAAIAAGGVAVGLTLSGPRQRETLERALAVRVDGKQLFTSVQATWNLYERSVEPALHAAKAAGWTVIVKEGLANGRLSPRAGAALPAALVEWARAAGVGVDAVALAAALAQPFADVVLSGATSVRQLEDNGAARAVDGERAAVELAGLAEPADQYWERRAAMAWN